MCGNSEAPACALKATSPAGGGRRMKLERTKRIFCHSWTTRKTWRKWRTGWLSDCRERLCYLCTSVARSVEWPALDGCSQPPGVRPCTTAKQTCGRHCILVAFSSPAQVLPDLFVSSVPFVSLVQRRRICDTRGFMRVIFSRRPSMLASVAFGSDCFNSRTRLVTLTYLCVRLMISRRVP